MFQAVREDSKTEGRTPVKSDTFSSMDRQLSFDDTLTSKHGKVEQRDTPEES